MYLYPTEREWDEMRWDRPGPDPVPGVAYEYGALYPGPLHNDPSSAEYYDRDWHIPLYEDEDECPCPECNPY